MIKKFIKERYHLHLAGAHDAYNIGDRVWFPELNSTLYESLIDANVYSPTAYPAGWQIVVL